MDVPLNCGTTVFMAKQIVHPRKKRGPPATGKGVPVQVRLQPPQLAALDGWIEAQPAPQPTRPEAIRQLIDLGIAASIPRNPK